MDVIIRPMEKCDVDRVYDLENEIFNDPWTFEQLNAETDGQNYKYPFVLDVDGATQGYACVWAFAGEVHLNNMAISASFQQKGLGLELINFILNHFNEHNEIFLEVRPTNEAAIRLYHKVGFRIVFTREKYYADGENALVMRKGLKRREE